MHLARLEAPNLVRSEIEVSEDGKAMHYVELAPFALQLTPAVIAAAVANASTTATDDRTEPEEAR